MESSMAVHNALSKPASGAARSCQHSKHGCRKRASSGVQLFGSLMLKGKFLEAFVAAFSCEGVSELMFLSETEPSA